MKVQESEWGAGSKAAPRGARQLRGPERRLLLGNKLHTEDARGEVTGGGEVTAVAPLLRPALGSFSLLSSAIVVDVSLLPVRLSPANPCIGESVLLPPPPASSRPVTALRSPETLRSLRRWKLCEPVLALQASIHPDGPVFHPNADDSRRRTSLRSADPFVQDLTPPFVTSRGGFK